MTQSILLTGYPGVGKTTVIRRVLEALSLEAGGFFTQEIREGNRRVGFKIITLDGQEAILAHVRKSGSPRISKYGVDVEALDEVGVASIQRALHDKSLIVIDEIGPMELLSLEFRQAVINALENDTPVLGTVVNRSTPFSDKMKSRQDVQVIKVTRENRDRLVETIAELIG